MEQVTDLPSPDNESLARSDLVLQAIDAACRNNNGLISFAEYMRIALYEPGLGYYTGGLTKFGEHGDFITAPEVSPLFSYCLANQVADIFKNLDDACVMEFGAGSGVMAADLLIRLETLQQLPRQYFIMEVSADLRQRQQQTLEEKAPHLLHLVSWLDAMPGQPITGVVLANEILDAMPVECFRKLGDSVEQLVIGYENGGLFSDYQEADQDLQRAVANIEHRLQHQLPDQYCSEVNLNIRPWLDSIYHCLQQGVVMLIDYGYAAGEYYLAERDKGTLVCHYQHRAHPNPFWHPGLQDITAFVDFTDVAHAADAIGFDVAGYTNQAAFLMSSGMADLHQELVNEDVSHQVMLSQQIKTLTLPSEMGERFKVMALARDYEQHLLGFLLQDHRGKL